MSVRHITEECTFDQLIKQSFDSDRFVVLKFSADFCGPCKVIAPLFKQLAEKYESNATFVHIDVEESEELAEQFNITAMPTFIVASPKKDNGLSVVAQMKGANREALVSLLKKHLEKESNEDSNEDSD